MRLDRLSATLRPRTAWEAIDLGFAMTRRWWRALLVPWLAALGGVVLLLAPLWWFAPGWALLALWWLKPLLDRVPLLVLSQALFGAPPPPRAALRALPGLLARRPLTALSLQRVDPLRSFHLPVVQLERLRGRARRERLRVLGSAQSGAGWLTVVCYHFEIVLVVALFGLVLMLFPEFADGYWFEPWRWREAPGWGDQMLLLGAFVIAVAAVEPFYVAAGFALYLNRRTELEAWDIEIGLRRLAQRLERERGRGGARAALLTAALLTAALPAPAPAQHDLGADAGVRVSPACRALDAEQQRLRNADSAVKRALAEVLREPEFPRCQQRERWLSPERDDVYGPAPFAANLAALLRGLLWLLAALALGYCAYWLALRARRPRLPSRSARAQRRTRPARFADEQRADEPGGDDSADAALALWRDGRQRDALALLYRATLTRLRAYGVEVARSATEQECLQRGAARLAERPELLAFLRRLTDSWMRLAYAGRAPDAAAVETLCAQWRQLFADAGPGAAGPGAAGPGAAGPGAAGPGAAGPGAAGSGAAADTGTRQ